MDSFPRKPMVNRKGIRCGARACQSSSGHWRAKFSSRSGFYKNGAPVSPGAPFFLCEPCSPIAFDFVLLRVLANGSLVGLQQLGIDLRGFIVEANEDDLIEGFLKVAHSPDGDLRSLSFWEAVYTSADCCERDRSRFQLES
jgi:hypothetical protein